MSDNVIEIRITGAVDPSLSASVSQANATLGTINDQTTAAAAAISDTLKAVGDGIGALTSQLRTLGGAAATAGAEVTLGLHAAEAATQALAGASAMAGSRVASGLKTAEDATHSLHFATASAIEDYFRLGQAAASGNLSSLGSTLLNLGKETGVFDAALATMGTEAAIATGGLAIVAGALGYLAYEEYQAAQNANALAVSFAMSGRGALMTAQAVREQIATLSQLPNVTTDIAESVLKWEAAHGEVIDQINDMVNQLLPKFGEAGQENTEEVTKAQGVLKETLNAIATGSVPQAAAAFDKMDKQQLHYIGSADAAKVATAQHIQKLIEEGHGLEAAREAFVAYAQESGAQIQTLDQRIDEQNAKVREAQKDLDDTRAAAAKMGPQLAIPFDLGKGAAYNFVDAVTEAKAKLDGLLAELHRLQANKTQKIPIQVDITAIQQHLQDISQNVNLTYRQILERQQDYLKREAADTRLSTEAQVFRQNEFARVSSELSRKEMQDKIDNARRTAEESGKSGEALTRLELANDQKLVAEGKVKGQALADLNKRIAQEKAQLLREEAEDEKRASHGVLAAEKSDAEDAISIARDAGQEILTNERLNASERGALAKQVWDLLESGDKQNAQQRATAAADLAHRIATEEGLSAEQQKVVEQQLSSILIDSAKLTSQQRTEITREEGSAESDARRKAASEVEQIVKIGEQSQVDAAKDAYETTSTLEDRKLAYFQETEGEKIAALRAAKEAELDVEIKGYQEQLKKLKDAKQTETTVYAQTKEKIEELNRQKNLVIEHSDTQAAQQAVKSWQSIISPIESGMSSMVSSLIGGQTKFGAATRQLLVQIVSDWVSARTKIEFDWLAGILAKELGDQKWAQKSILEALFAAKTETTIQKGSEAEKTATTAAGVATRDALGATENTGFLGRIVDQIAQWLGLETSKTAETATGTAARITASGAETAATIAAAKAQAAGEIPAYTGIAAMEAASAVADIPIIGPGLALAAAEAMNAQGATELSIATAEGGMESVDAAEQAVLVHRKESILPARISVPLMSFVSDLPAMAERVKQNSAPDLRSIADVGSLIPVMSPGASVRAAQRTQAPQSDADYVASRVGGGRAGAPQSSAPSKTRGGDIHIHAWDASSMNQFFRKPANRRTMDQISKDRVRAGFLPA